MYVASLPPNYDPLRYTHIVWGSENGYSITQHNYQLLISFASCWSIHIFYIIPVTVYKDLLNALDH